MSSRTDFQGQGQFPLIERWLPTTELGIESVRERAAFTALPPHYALHVWFARRPLVASRASIAASVMQGNVEENTFKRLVGLPIGISILEAEAAKERAKAENRRLKDNPYRWPRAFTHSPSAEELHALGSAIPEEWKDSPIQILDPMGGGGSIPLEGVRLGLRTATSDLNPVAFLCLLGTVDYPARFGKRIVSSIRQFCSKVEELSTGRLDTIFPSERGEEIYRYLWARTVPCPTCGLLIPLSPNWWLNRDDDSKLAVRVLVRKKGEGNTCTFELVKNPEKEGYDPDKGTERGKDATCPRDGTVVTSEEIKEVAQGKKVGQSLGHQMYAISIKRPGPGGGGGKAGFRLPTEADLKATEEAKTQLKQVLARLEPKGLVPTEAYEAGFSDRVAPYGVARWTDMFNPRQLLAHLTYLECFLEVKKSWLEGATPGTEEWGFRVAVVDYAAMVFDACVNYNSIQTRWHSKRGVVAGSMDMQAFPFRSSYTEAEHLHKTWGWATKKVTKVVEDLSDMMPPGAIPATVRCQNAMHLNLPDKSIPCIVVDPPYGKNVMYSEVSDFFYVWLKRLVGDLHPKEFSLELTDKDDEAVENPARFERQGSKGRSAADQAKVDYRAKMEASFREMARVLRDDGILTVMFSHREAEAWASLATALLRAGFTFRASWPVEMEPGGKFGKEGKGVIKAGIIFACRKRSATPRKGVWENVEGELRALAAEEIKQLTEAGFEGLDLLVAAYGPILGRFGDFYPIKTATGKDVGPSEALEVVAEVLNEVFERQAGLSGADKTTCAYLSLLRYAPTGTADYDTARLATMFGGNVTVDSLDCKNGPGLAEKKGSKVIVLAGSERVVRGHIDPLDASTLHTVIDTIHGSIGLYGRQGLTPVRELLRIRGLDRQGSSFLPALNSYVGLAGEALKEELRKEAATGRALLGALGYSASFKSRPQERLDDWGKDGNLRK